MHRDNGHTYILVRWQPIYNRLALVSSSYTMTTLPASYDDVVIDISTPEATNQTIAQLQTVIQQLLSQVRQLTNQNSQTTKQRVNSRQTTVLSDSKKRTHNNLDSSSESENEDDTCTTKIFRPPPFYINSDKAKVIMNQITDVSNEKDELKPTYFTRSDGVVKINAKTEDSYRKIRSLLDKDKIEYFSHQLKSEKLYRVVVRGLHPQTDPESIKSEFGAMGHDVEKVTNVIITKKDSNESTDGSRTKIALPLFFVDLRPKPNNKLAFEIQTIEHQRVRIEEPRSRADDIPQCKNCQDLGHTRNFCHKKARCVKCGDFHQSSQCKKPREVAPKCACCGGQHTANWRGCPAYKAAVSKKRSKTTSAVERIRQTEAKITSEETTYAQITRENANGLRVPPPSQDTPAETLANIASQITALTNGLSEFKAQVTKRLESLETKIAKAPTQKSTKNKQ